MPARRSIRRPTDSRRQPWSRVMRSVCAPVTAASCRASRCSAGRACGGRSARRPARRAVARGSRRPCAAPGPIARATGGRAARRRRAPGLQVVADARPSRSASAASRLRSNTGSERSAPGVPARHQAGELGQRRQRRAAAAAARRRRRRSGRARRAPGAPPARCARCSGRARTGSPPVRLATGARRAARSSTVRRCGSIEKVSTGPSASTQVSRLVPPCCIDTDSGARVATRVRPPGSTCQRPPASAIA